MTEVHLLILPKLLEELTVQLEYFDCPVLIVIQPKSLEPLYTIFIFFKNYFSVITYWNNINTAWQMLLKLSSSNHAHFIAYESTNI